ncbi:YycH family regulatory protein [Lactobacillus crispatus]|uniref:YycH family regulatory protein n=1 Tax=Lactobacillus crispatus TaxID=47770 RepID=UPI001239FB30|nr:hypothetical protein [Lactobacillus crispatus]KAA8809626.1 hypothetical protein F1C08_07550 [Lactobacillus crispatus]
MIGMKFKFKFGEFFLGLATLIVIVLSIVLWIFIMTSDQRFSNIGQQNQNNITKEQTRSHNFKSLYDLYIPTTSYGFANGNLCQLYDSKNNLTLEFTKEIKKAKATNKIKKIVDTRTKYEEYLNNPNYVQLVYPDEITFSLFNQLNNAANDNREFNRFFISQSNHWIYLGNDHTNEIYQVKIAGANFDKLRKYARNAKSKYPVRLVRLKEGYSPFYIKTMNAKVYSYLTNHQSYSYFVSRLLGTSGVTSKTNKNGQTVYSLNYYTRLRVPDSNSGEHNYLYTHYEKNKIPNTTNRLLDSVYYVHQLGLTEQDLRFFDADGANVSYLNYIEGIPVFLNKHDLQVKTTFSTDSINVAFNSVNFQIPIPFDGQTKRLKPTQDVVDELVNHGLKQEDIQRIIVGFAEEKDSSHHSLINLIPTYYIKAYDEWKSLGEWEKQDVSTYREADQLTVNEGGK